MLPLVVRVDPEFKEGPVSLFPLLTRRVYFVWCFGIVFPLPI